MEPLAYIKQRAGDNWIVGYDSSQLIKLFEYYSQLIDEQDETPPKIILAESEPLNFLAGFMAAIAKKCPVFLCNPNWVKQEWEQVFELVQPDLIFAPEALDEGERREKRGERREKRGERREERGERKGGEIKSGIMIPTGGSSGKIKFTIHTWETLMSSVTGFQQYFQVDRVNSFCVLPLYHVSGLMQFIRSLTCNGQLVIMPFKSLESGEIGNINPADFFISLVPTQLQRLLNQNHSWLPYFQTILLGGAPAWPELLHQARRDRLRLAPTYGMTETASQIVTLKPEDFLNGNNSYGQILPHAQITICNPNGEILGVNQTGIITIQADSLALGYYPNRSFVVDASGNKIFQTDDLGFFDDRGNINIVGRNTQKIITGGENVFPAEVEAAIQSTNLVSDVCAIGIPDRHWGQVVTAVYVPINSEISSQILLKAIEDKLSKFKRPKYWVSVESLPRNYQGKINYNQLHQIVQSVFLE